jgi:SAM-dependent methyltransferase
VVGLDPTPTFIAVAEALRSEAGLSNVRFEVGDGRRLHLPSAGFDAVLAVTVLSHLPDREQVLYELRRVVRFGGRVLVVDGDYAANQLAHPDRALTDRIVAAWRETTVDDQYLARRLVPLVAASGLAVEQVRGHVHVEAGRVDEDASFIWQWSLFALRQALGAGAISEAEGAAWLDGLRRLNAAGEIYGSVTYVSVLARRP